MTPSLPFRRRVPEVERPDGDTDSGGLAEDAVPFDGVSVPARLGAGLEQVKQNRLGWSLTRLPSELIVPIDPRCLRGRGALIHNHRRIDRVSTGPQQSEINDLPVIHVSCMLSLRFATLSLFVAMQND